MLSHVVLVEERHEVPRSPLELVVPSCHSDIWRNLLLQCSLLELILTFGLPLQTAFAWSNTKSAVLFAHGLVSWFIHVYAFSLTDQNEISTAASIVQKINQFLAFEMLIDMTSNKLIFFCETSNYVYVNFKTVRPCTSLRCWKWFLTQNRVCRFRPRNAVYI